MAKDGLDVTLDAQPMSQVSDRAQRQPVVHTIGGQSAAVSRLENVLVMHLL